MHRRLILLLLALLCAFGAASCGGDDDVDVDEVLRQTFGDDKDIDSGRLDLNLRLDARGLAQLQGPVRVRLSGPFASSDADELPRFDLEAELDAGGQTIRAGATSTGEKGFLSFQGQAYVLSDQLYQQFKEGYAQEAKKNEDDKGISFKSLGIDPRRWLRDPEYAGKEETGGAETLHVKAGIDVPRLLEDVNRILSRAEDIPGQQAQQARELTEEERRQLSEAIKDAKLELWTGEDDKILRRINVQLSFDVPEANREAANGLTGGTLRFDLALGAINDEQKIEGPEDARPFEELIQAVGGGEQSGESSDAQPPPGDSGSGGGGGGGDEAATPYEKCVAEAGADIAKLQECAGLAGG